MDRLFHGPTGGSGLDDPRGQVYEGRRQTVRCGGLLQGYRHEEEALHTVRGRIRFNDQVNRRFGVPLLLEVAFDEFTEDI